MVVPNVNFPSDPDDSKEPHDPEFEPRDAGRQPACPADLEASPPQGETCVSVRGMLRDFADGDLTDVERAAVESHAHACRACALALSRAESERMQISAALADIDIAAAGPSSGFTDSVMRAVRELAVTQPPVGFTTRVMARVRETALADEVLASAVLPRRRHRLPLYLALAATVMFATWIGLRLFESPPSAEVEVIAAANAEMIRDGARISLVATDHWDVGEHHAADEFVTGDGGSLELMWKTSGKAVALRAGERTNLRVRSAAGSAADPYTDPAVFGKRSSTVDLGDGVLRVETDGDVDLKLHDGSFVDLAPGRYRVTVQRVRHQDARTGLRVKVHVRDGAARIQRGGRTTLVAAGSQALYTTFTPVVLDRAPDDDLFLASKRRARDRMQTAPPVAPRPRQFFGRVLDPRTSTAVANVSVAISTSLGDQTVTTNADGLFELTGRAAFRGQFVLVRAVPPTAMRDLAPLRFAPVFLDPRDETPGGQGGAVHRFFLARAGVVQGRVQDASRRALAGSWLQAVVVNELLGSAVPLGPRVLGDRVGRFTMRGLPMASNPHQTMLILAGAADRRARVVWARTAVRVEDSALDIVLPANRGQRVGGFTPGEVVPLLFAVEGVPAGSGVWPATMRADAAGRLALDLTAPVFLLSATQAPRLLVPKFDGEAAFRETALPRTLADLRVGSLATDRMHWFRRDTLPALARVGADGGFISVYEESSGQACPGAWVFLRSPGGSMAFLGVYDGRVPLRCARETVGRILVITPEGWVGQFSLDGPLGRSSKSIAVQKPGRIAWQGTTKGVVFLRRSPRRRALPIPIARPGDESEWLLRPGNYRFGSQTFRLDPNATTPLK